MAERVQIVAHDTGDRFVAPQTNLALELAHSLRGLEPELNQTLDAIGNQARQQEEARARQDVLKTSGKRFAEAVRSGEISATQNPWYMHLATIHGEPEALLSDRNRRLLAEGSWKDCAYVYRPKANPSAVLIVLGSGGYRELIDHSDFGRGSNLVADRKLFDEIAGEEAVEGKRTLTLLAVEDLLEEARIAT